MNVHIYFTIIGHGILTLSQQHQQKAQPWIWIRYTLYNKFSGIASYMHIKQYIQQESVSWHGDYKQTNKRKAVEQQYGPTTTTTTTAKRKRIIA